MEQYAVGKYLIVILMCLATASCGEKETPPTMTRLVFADEFDQDGAVDTTKWLFETVPPNNGSWWNGEKQHYTDRLDNAHISDGTLKIVARKDSFTVAGSTKEYTSARLNSTFSFTYGRVEVRAKLPQGAGTWPAIWTLGSNIDSVNWPACGEIDIMEHWGHDPTKISSAIHTTACSGVSNCKDHRVGTQVVKDYDSNFHTYSMEWTPESITFYLDNQRLYAYNPRVKTADNWPFTKDQYLLLNVAVGGAWFDVDPTFTQSTMEIDYVRVYQP
ncbi:MAG: glycoside hydrolase family 16 protein [Bacteroidota bacterium]